MEKEEWVIGAFKRKKFNFGDYFQNEWHETFLRLPNNIRHRPQHVLGPKERPTYNGLNL